MADSKPRVAGCFLEYDGKFVIFHRHAHKPDGNTWGLPGGKVELGESDLQAIIRELYEETGYRAAPGELEHLGDFDFDNSEGMPFVYVTFRVRLQQPHDVILEDAAHQGYKWVSARECYAMPDIIFGLDDLLERVGYISKIEA